MINVFFSGILCRFFYHLNIPYFCLRAIAFEVFGASSIFSSLVDAGTFRNRYAVTVFVQGRTGWTVAAIDADGLAPSI
jgi:hypothetical protein